MIILNGRYLHEISEIVLVWPVLLMVVHGRPLDDDWHTAKLIPLSRQ